MPELPEVFTISEDLKKILPNSVLENVEIIEKYRSIPETSEFSKILNTKVKEVSRISKYILITFENSLTLLFHLGMTGRIRYSETSKDFGWDKIKLQFSNEGRNFFINFTDTRKFGKVKILNEVKINTGTEVFNLTSKEKENIVIKISKKNTEIFSELEELKVKIKVLETDINNLRGNFNRKLTKLKKEDMEEKKEETQTINNPVILPYNGSFR